MNKIVSTDFITDDVQRLVPVDATATTPKNAAVAKLMKAWEAKTTQRAAKATGFTLMAVSLAACNDDNTTTTTTPTTPTTPVTPAGQTFTLTDKIDVTGVLVGSAGTTSTAGPDTFISDQATASAADQIDGGAGNDTFKLFTTGAVSLPTLSNVENIYIQGANVAIDTSSVTGVTSVELNKYVIGAGLNVKIADGTKLTLSDTTGTATTVTLTNNTATSQTIAVSKSGDKTNAIDLDIDGDLVATLNVEATGASFINIANDGAVLKTVNISGASDITVEGVAVATAINVTNTAKTAVTTGVAKVVVTGGAGAETVSLSHATATAHEFSVSTGAGDDRVVLTNLAVAADLTDDKVTISGGAGSDTIAMKSALGNALSGLTAANFAKKGIANDFETLEITDLAITTDAVNIARLGSNITKVDYAAGLGDAQTLTGLASGGTIALGAAASVVTDSLTVTVLNAAAAGNNSDVLNIVLDGLHTTTSIDYGVVVAANVETINISSTTTKTTELVTANTNIVDLTLANAVNVTVSGNVYADLDGAALTGGALSSINASANTAGVAVTVTGATQGILITGTAKADIIIGGSGADNITAGAGNDAITGGAGNDIINISGGGSNTLVFAATAAGNGKDTITGFNVGAVAGGGDVLDVSGLVTVAALTTVTSLTGATTIVDDAVIVVKFAILRVLRKPNLMA